MSDTIKAWQAYTATVERRNGWDGQTGSDAVAMLAEEVGEVSRAVKRLTHHRDGHNESYTEEEKIAEVQEELADTLFVISKIANLYGIDLSDGIGIHLSKMKKRGLM